MSDWTGVIRQAAVQDNMVIQHYIKGLIPCQIAEKTGFPRFFVEQAISRIVAQYPALTGGTCGQGRAGSRSASGPMPGW